MRITVSQVLVALAVVGMLAVVTLLPRQPTTASATESAKPDERTEFVKSVFPEGKTIGTNEGGSDVSPWSTEIILEPSRVMIFWSPQAQPDVEFTVSLEGELLLARAKTGMSILYMRRPGNEDFDESREQFNSLIQGIRANPGRYQWQ
jgi:hypothetical protein